MARLVMAVLAATALLGCGDSAGGDDDDEAAAGGSGVAGTGGAGAGAQAGTGASGHGGANAGGGGNSGMAGDDALPPLPNGSREYQHVLNLVDAEATAQLEGYLRQTEHDLTLAAQAFYPHYRDEYDFLFFMLDRDLGVEAASAAFKAVRKPAIPGTGAIAVLDNLEYYSAARLKGVIGVQMPSDNAFGPLAHEVLHYWAAYLDRSLGFGHDLNHDAAVADHWGLTSVHGQLGGFDADSIRCEMPAGAVPPDCTPLPNGRYRYLFDQFGLVTNSFAGVDYAPLELYLMGLIPASEVPDPILVLTDGAYDIESAMNGMSPVVAAEASGIGEIRMADVIARHGERAPATEDERAFTSAFVLVTAEPASEAAMARLQLWSDIFGNHAPSPQPGWKSFEQTTGGRATLSCQLGPRRSADDPFVVPQPPAPRSCDVLLQDCDPGMGCYDPEEPRCLPSSGIAVGQPCEYSNDCVAGSVCSIGSGDLCAPYCDLEDVASPKACEALCPGSYVTVVDDETFAEVGAYCLSGAGGACDPLAPDCEPGQGCYGVQATSCQLAGQTAQGEACIELGTDCVPGTTCVGLQGSANRFCQPYCDPSATASGSDACMTLCPGEFWEFEGYGICMPPA
jgi:hypothetical protein